MKKNRIPICINCLLSLVLGALIYIVLFGMTTLNPNNVDWISISHSDLRAHYIGWEFFRRTEWLFPLGKFNTLSYPIYTSILNTDSLPLLAIIFKMFSAFLPKNFQYFGFFGISCYMLQSLFGMLLINKFVSKNVYGAILSILGGILFTLIPILWFPMWWHTTLSSQWLILVCFLLILYKNELTTKQQYIYYSLLGFITAITQPYFLAFLGLILFVFCLYSIVKKKEIDVFFFSFVFALVAVVTLYVIGGFSMNSSYSAPHLYEDSFNLNGFFNSFGSFSFFTNIESYSSSQQIGFAYWGIGIFLLFIISTISFIVKTKTFSNFCSKIIKYKIELSFFILLIIFSFTLALSPRITFGSNILCEISYPEKIIELWSIFRSTGRFIWIANYVFLLMMIVYIVKNMNFKYSLTIFLVCIMFQIYDFIPAIQGRNYDLKKPILYHSYLQNELWNDIPQNNDIKVVHIDTLMYESSNYFDLDIAKWAYENNLYLNDFDFSRAVKGLNEIYFDKLQNPDNSDIFIFDRKNYPKELIAKSPLLYFYEMDNLLIARLVPIRGLNDVIIPKNNL